MSGSAKKRVAVLISGRGSNMAALMEAAKADGYPAQIVGVLADRAAADGLKTAQDNGIATAVFERANYADKRAHETSINAQLAQWDVEYVCLAGFMRLLSAQFLAPWAGRIINIHPSLLPLYKGLDTHQRALDAGDKEHGCTVHHVTAGMDEGPIIAQARVPVLPDDGAADLAARVLIEEHKLYPAALAQLIGENRP